jgi:hypothetical protein
MFQTHNSRHHGKHLVALVGLTTWLMSPGHSVNRPEPSESPTTPTLRIRPEQPVSVSRSTPPDEATQVRVKEAYGKLPLTFEANQGQTDARVKFLARGSGYSLFLTSEEAVLIRGRVPEAGDWRAAALAQNQPAPIPHAPTPAALRMKLVRANPAPTVVGGDELPGESHYFIGNDPRQWRTDIAHYGKVMYEGVYPGVDLVYYGNQGQLEYDFVVGAGADPRAIELTFSGAREVRLGAEGDLVLGVGDGEIRQLKPVIYQEVDGVKKEIAGGYRIDGQAHVSFEVGRYDASRPLVIDPVLVYSTYLGGSGSDLGLGIAVDEDGCAYVTGLTASLNFPTTPGAFQPANAGSEDAFVTKLNRRGTAVLYSTYLGGSGSDAGLLPATFFAGIAVDEDGNAYLTGPTTSPDFPTTPGAFQLALAGPIDTFVTKLNHRGSALLYSTYLGGSSFEVGRNIALDRGGNAYVTGSTGSLDFPTTAGVFQPAFGGGANDAFVTKLNSRGTALVYSTYLGGSSFDPSRGMAVDKKGNAYIGGTTASPDFPTTPDAFQPAFAGVQDVFVTKLNRRGTALRYSTYLGGSGNDQGAGGVGLAVDEDGNAYLVGLTNSLDFPTTPDAFQPAFAGGSNDAFVTKLNRRGTALLYSTYLGGSGTDFGLGDVAVDEDGSAYVTGATDSLDFPTTPDAYQPAFAGGLRDVFVTKLNRRGTALLYSTYLGGSGSDSGRDIAVDEDGNAYVTGNTDSLNFPTTPGAFQTVIAASNDAFVAKIGDDDEDDDEN